MIIYSIDLFDIQTELYVFKIDMILYLTIPISLCLWLIVFGVYEGMDLPKDPAHSPTKLSFETPNNTVIFIVLDAFRYDYADRYISPHLGSSLLSISSKASLRTL